MQSSLDSLALLLIASSSERHSVGYHVRACRAKEKGVPLVARRRHCERQIRVKEIAIEVSNLPIHDIHPRAVLSDLPLARYRVAEW